MLVLCGFISTTSEMVWTHLEEGQWILVEGRSGWNLERSRTPAEGKSREKKSLE